MSVCVCAHVCVKGVRCGLVCVCVYVVFASMGVCVCVCVLCVFGCLCVCTLSSRVLIQGVCLECTKCCWGFMFVTCVLLGNEL